MRNVVPPAIVDDIDDRIAFVEFESSIYGRPRFNRMATALLNGAEQLKQDWIKGVKEGAVLSSFKNPFMMVYARQMTRELRDTFLSVAGAPGLYRQMVSDLQFFVLDCSQVPSDSEYCHLRMLHAPVATTEKEYTSQVYTRILNATQHSFMKGHIFQEFVMSTSKILFPQPDAYDQFMGKTLHDILNEGREEGRDEGREEGREEGAALATRRHIRQLAQKRGIGLTSESEAILAACTELKQLETWLLHIGTTEDTTVTLHQSP